MASKVLLKKKICFNYVEQMPLLIWKVATLVNSENWRNLISIFAEAVNLMDTQATYF